MAYILKERKKQMDEKQTLRIMEKVLPKHLTFWFLSVKLFILFPGTYITRKRRGRKAIENRS